MTILDKVKKLYKDNHKVGELGDIHYDYTCPSPKNYPHQWLWDSCFHAIVLTHFDPERAKREMKTLLLKQRKDGLIPCVSIWKRRFPFEEALYIKTITQTPVIPIAVETIYERTHDRKFVGEVYPKLKKFFDWLSNNRDRNGNGLLEIIHPWEAGTDSIPSFDRQLGIKSAKPSAFENFYALFRVLVKYQLMGWNEDKIYKSKIFINENLVFNSVYAKSLISLIKLAKIVGKEDDARIFNGRYKKTRSAILKLCWSAKDKIFYDLDEKGRQIRVKSISSLMPLILPDLPREISESLVSLHFLNDKEFWTPYPLASVPKDGREFSAGNGFVLSRGPTWVEINWFMSKALAQKGYNNVARAVVKQTKKMIEKSGFMEFYNPFTGEGYGQPNLGWSALVLDMQS